MTGHQPKELTELAFASFTAYMKEQALQFLKWMEVPLPCAEIEIKSSGTCRELKDFFHGTSLPPVLANEITKRLLTLLDMFSVIYESARKDYFQQILLSLVELFLHPNVTSIELGSSYLYNSGYVYYNFIVTTVLMNVDRLHNLKTLSLGFGINIHLEGVKLVLPAQLKELTLCGSLFLDNDNLKNIVACCRELKTLKILRCAFSGIGVPDILKLNRLETLHLLGEFGNGLDQDCVYFIDGISTDEKSDVLSTSTLKSFGIELRYEHTLHLIVDKLLHLTEIVLELPLEFDLSCLTQLKNLRSLTLDALGRKSEDYKKILPVLGKSLVSLELRGYENLDFEFIGETCSKLRYLHVTTIAQASAPRPKPSSKTFPNFRTVERLNIKIIGDYVWIEFLIAQCVNVKVLSVVMFDQANIIENILKRTTLTSLMEIHWYPAVRIENSCFEELCFRCPNLRLVHGLGSDRELGRVVFDFDGCEKSFCESFWYVLETLDKVPVKYLFDSTSDSENDYTSDSGNDYTSDSENDYTSDSDNF